jgi:hypothetical protein
MVRKLLTLLLLTVIVALPSNGGAINGQKKLPCAGNPDLLRNKKGKLVWFSSDDLKGKAISQVAPKFPLSCRCIGTIIVYVQINTEGEVVCAETFNGHPLLQAASLVAARKWKFKPTLKDDKPVPVVGWLSFNFSSEEYLPERAKPNKSINRTRNQHIFYCQCGLRAG